LGNSPAKEAEGRVAGFILGNASGWEYGVSNTVGWIDTIGVHPGYQQRGIARALLVEMIDRQVPRKPRPLGGELHNLKKVGVDTIYTFVNWRD
jgi:ribosomal protein S18 acetylase RimI-like enzyme